METETQILSTSSIAGKSVYNLEGEKIGNIKDLVIYPEEAKVAYAVLSFGGIMGIGDKLFAIPIEALRMSDENKIRVDIDKNRLEDAPSFDKDNWPRTANPEFMDSVYGHYGIEQDRRIQ